MSTVFQHHALSEREARSITSALRTLERILHRPGETLTSPQAVRTYLTLRLAALPHEVFMGLFVDSRNALITADELFRGTLSSTTVYPREVVKRALSVNAAAVIFAHNHPSGQAEPSHADKLLTEALKRSLATVDVPVLDHIVVAGTQTYSFAEHGLI